MAVDLDNPQTWGDASLQTPPSFDVAGFQRRIDQIVGVAASGASIVRLIWPWSKEGYLKFYSKWDAGGFGIETELRAKYRYMTVDVNKTDYIDIPTPRWILEQRVEPAQYAASWEQTRWQFNAQERKRIERRPPAPLDGYYKPHAMIAEHRNGCCEKINGKCFGFYRVPAGDTLRDLAEAKFQRDNDPTRPYQDPNEPFNEETLAFIEHETAEYMDEYETRKRKQMQEYIDEFGLEMLTNITGMDAMTKDYSIPTNFKPTGSGILIPE